MRRTPGKFRVRSEGDRISAELATEQEILRAKNCIGSAAGGRVKWCVHPIRFCIRRARNEEFQDFSGCGSSLFCFSLRPDGCRYIDECADRSGYHVVTERYFGCEDGRYHAYDAVHRGGSSEVLARLPGLR